MAAMIIFSMILMNANSLIHRNSMIQIDGELEQEVISLGQEIIEEARSKSFDQVTVNAAAPPTNIPGGFTAPQNFPPAPNNMLRESFEAFEHYHNYSETITTAHGDFSITVAVFYVDEDNFNWIGTQTTFKKIEVTVESEFLRSGNASRQYKLEFIRNYYAE